MDNELEGVLSYLSSQPYHASREWVEGCVSFFREDRAEQGYSVHELRKFVAQQWELADLREISPGCLPSDLALQKKVLLPGRYSLQVETKYDISQSFYSQLQKMKNVNLENITATDVKKSESWEPKQTRMIHLMLCDGVQVVKAIEYRPIMSLKRDIIPGFKVIIIGPVDCRRGVILLEEKNLKLIGGEVDSLLIPNAPENVFARALNLEENPDPYKLHPESRGLGTPSLPQAPVQRNEESSTVDQFPDDDDFALVADSVVANIENNQFHNTSRLMNNQDEVDEMELALVADSVVAKIENNQCHNTNKTRNNQDEVDEMELAYQRDIDFDNIDYLEQQNIGDIRRLVASKVVKPTESIRKQSNKSNSDMDLLDADDNDDIFLNMPSNDFDFKNMASTSKCESITSNKKLSKSDFSSSKSISLKQKEPVNRKSGGHQNFTNITTKNLKNDTEIRNMNKSENYLSHRNTIIEDKYLFCNRKNKSTKLSVLNSSLENVNTVQNRDKTSDNVSLQDEISSDLYNFSEYNLDADRSIDSNSCNLDACENDTGIDVQTAITSEQPFIYLCQIDRCINNLEVYTVKAFVVTLTSLLSMKPDGWHLTAKISDGSAIVEILFSSTVLEEVIGYSRNEIHALKRDVSKNPLIKEKIKKALESAQQQLINLNALFHINFDISQDIPTIVGVTNITESHWKELKARVNSVA